MFANHDFTRNFISAAGAALLTTACLFVATAPADATAVAASTAVSHADLDLAHPQGRATLHGRVKSAARTVCPAGGVDLKSRQDETRCIKTAIAAATRQ